MAKRNSSPPGFPSYEESYPVVMTLSDADAGRFSKAKYAYWFDGKDPDFSTCEKQEKVETMWAYEKSQLDKARYSYYLTCVQRAYGSYVRDHRNDPDFMDSIRDWFTWKRRINQADGVEDPVYLLVNEADLTQPKIKKRDTSEDVY